MHPHRLTASLSACAPAVACSSVGDASRPRPAVMQDDCAALAAAGVPNGSLSSATPVAAGTVIHGNTLPEHCVLQGRLNPRTEADGKPYHIASGPLRRRGSIEEAANFRCE